MRHSLPAAGRRLVSALLAIFLLAASALAQSTVTIPGVAELSDLLHRGEQMEQQSRWGEALSCYEDALRQNPSDTGIKQRFDLTRLHYDLGRRYHDRSYRTMLGRLSTAEALDLYGEVLLKIQTHYVDMPRWKDLVGWGTSGVEVAMTEPVFLQNNLPKATTEALNQFRKELRQALDERVIRTRSDARDAANLAGSLAQQRLGLNPGVVVLEYTCAAASSLDPYSTYLTSDQLSEVYSQIEGNFVGLGVELKAQDGTLLIVRVIPNSPAKQAGLLEEERILAIDGQAVGTASTDRAANLLQGQPNSLVRLSIRAASGQTRDVVVRRQRVEVPSVDEVQILDPSLGIGYLKLTCFQKTTFRDLETALWSLHRNGMRSLVIDLRGNPGGLLVSAVETADLFIERGVIVSTRGRSAQEDYTYSAHEPGTWRVPLVVVVDQDSASAAEIFAGAIRDHARGTIVGRRSYGKGSVQGIFPLNTGSAGIRLTTAKFYSPAGRPYAGIGVEPHLVVHQVARPIGGPTASASPQDPYIAAALQAVQQLTAQR